MKELVKLLVRTSRPIVWTWFAAPFLVGFIISGSSLYRPLFWFELLLLGPLYCLVVYGVNDIYDYETDLQNDRKGEGKSQGDVLRPDKHRVVMYSSIVSSLILVAVAVSTKNLVNIGGMVFLILWAFAYSAPPIRLKERPILDSISNGLGYVLVPALMGFSLGSPISNFPEAGIWAAVVISSMHALFAIMDYKPDRNADVNTIAVKFGPKKVIWYPLIATSATLLFSPLNGIISRILISALLILTVLIALDLHNAIKFPKELRDKTLGLIYATGIILTTYFLLATRGVI